MHLDFVNKALESAKALQQTVGEALAKGTEQAKPLISQAVDQAQTLQKTIADKAPTLGDGAQAQLKAAQEHLGDFVNTGKDLLGKGAGAASTGLAPLAENARNAIHQAAKAVTEKTAPPK